MEDIASFVKAMNSKYELSNRNLWVTWGGSYPGMLAGWSRLKHPELIHASVASSAPVFATFDMPQYTDHMAYAYTISHEGVGGSESCRQAIRKGHAWVEEPLESFEGSLNKAQPLGSSRASHMADATTRAVAFVAVTLQRACHNSFIEPRGC